MTRSDKIALAHIVFFCSVAFTFELYWLIHVHDITRHDDVFARAFGFYGRGDRGYYDQISGFEYALEFIQVFITVPAYMLLFYAIINRLPFRWPLQLCVGAYVAYSVTLYFIAKTSTDYAQMPTHDLSSFLIFYLPNLPWFTGNIFLAIEASRAMIGAIRQREREA